jgi:hypothetical protein
MKGNDCKPVVKKLKKHYDTIDTQNRLVAEGKKKQGISEPKIIELECNTMDQLEQCMFGYNYIKEHFKPDFVQLIDADELWDEENWEKAINHLKKYPDAKTYRTHLYQYIKSPYYRIEPAFDLRPVCFIRPDLETLGDTARCCTLQVATDTMKGVWYHHFSHVRLSFNRVLEKIMTSHISEHCEYQDMSAWIPGVWNMLPDWNKQEYKDGFHPNFAFRGNWSGIRAIEDKDLPEVLRGSEYPIMKVRNES